MWRHCWPATLLWLLGAVSCGPFTLDEPWVIEDPDYLFRLVRPGPGWHLMDEEQVREMVPDAIAGVASPPGRFGVVIVERIPGVRLEDLVDALVQNMPLEDLVVEERDALQVAGYEALRVQFTGVISEIPFRYRVTVILRGEFAYQLLCWGHEQHTRTAARSFGPIERSFSFLDGSVRTRLDRTPTPDTSGVGWRVRDGVYESATFGLRVAPPEQWRLIVGEELLPIHSMAEFGLVARTGDLYLVAICERIVGADREAVRSRVFEDVELNLGVALDAAEIEHDVGGRTVTFRRARVTEGLPLDYLLGVHWEDEILVQILTWYTEAGRSRAHDELVEVLGAIRFLGRDQRAALTESLHRGTEAGDHVGLGFSLRRGVYRDFEHGFAWSSPPGLWKVITGQEARAYDPAAVIVIKEPALGLTGSLVQETDVARKGKRYHRLVAEALWGPDAAAANRRPRRTIIDGKSAFTSSGAAEGASGDLRSVVTTLVDRGRAYQIAFWGFPGNVEAAAGPLDAALHAFEFPDVDMAPAEMKDGTWMDHRFGYAFSRPGPGWTFTDMTTGEQRPISTTVKWQRGNEEIVAGALSSLSRSTNAADVMRRIMNWILVERDVSPERSRGDQLDGVPAERMVWEGARHLEALYAQRGRTVYFVICGAPRGERTLALHDAKQLFRFTD